MQAPDSQEWLDCYRRLPEATRQWVYEVVEIHSSELAAAFYRDLLRHPAASARITADLLQNRLLPAVQRWMLFLFDPANAASPSPTVALQRHVGEVHARVGVSADLIALGFRGFKRGLNVLLVQEGHSFFNGARAVAYAGELIDLAHAEMAVAQSRVEGLVPPGHNALEHERSKTLLALSTEESLYLQSMLASVAPTQVHALGPSPLGQWLDQEAPLLFSDAAHVQALRGVQLHLQRLDQDVLPRLQHTLPVQSDSMALLREVVAVLETVRQQINALFDSFAATDGHRDALTQLFNRPLLAALLRREMGLARRKRSTFSVLLVDIDHFKEVNARYGHAAGDRVLQHVSNLLATQVRSSDFVFRYGGEEFLLLLVDLDAEQSMAVAEKIRRTVEATDIPLPEGGCLQVTLSLGVTTYGGQTEVDSVTELAERALGRAKGGGRNQVCMI